MQRINLHGYPRLHNSQMHNHLYREMMWPTHFVVVCNLAYLLVSECCRCGQNCGGAERGGGEPYRGVYYLRTGTPKIKSKPRLDAFRRGTPEMRLSRAKGFALPYSYKVSTNAWVFCPPPRRRHVIFYFQGSFTVALRSRSPPPKNRREITNMSA